jgi:hypothetical protein
MFIIVKSKKEWEERKWRARYQVSKAIKAGNLKRPKECGKCKKKCKPMGHHSDYERQLDVEWLCSKCHYVAHSNGFLSHDRRRELNREAADRWHDRPHGRYRERFGDHAVPSPT